MTRTRFSLPCLPATTQMPLVLLALAIALLASVSSDNAQSVSGSTLTAPALKPETVRSFSGIEFVWVPAGTFQMGSQARSAAIAHAYGGEERLFKVEHPQHQVTLTKGFWLGR